MIIGGMGDGDDFLSDTYVMSAGCAGNLTLTETRGAFGDGDGTYLNNLDCRWLLKPSLGRANVMLFFSSLQVRSAAPPFPPPPPAPRPAAAPRRAPRLPTRPRSSLTPFPPPRAARRPQRPPSDVRRA